MPGPGPNAARVAGAGLVAACTLLLVRSPLLRGSQGAQEEADAAAAEGSEDAEDAEDAEWADRNQSSH